MSGQLEESPADGRPDRALDARKQDRRLDPLPRLRAVGLAEVDLQDGLAAGALGGGQEVDGALLERARYRVEELESRGVDAAGLKPGSGHGQVRPAAHVPGHLLDPCGADLHLEEQVRVLEKACCGEEAAQGRLFDAVRLHEVRDAVREVDAVPPGHEPEVGPVAAHRELLVGGQLTRKCRHERGDALPG